MLKFPCLQAVQIEMEITLFSLFSLQCAKKYICNLPLITFNHCFSFKKILIYFMTQFTRHWSLPLSSPGFLLSTLFCTPVLQGVSLVNFHKSITLSLRCLQTMWKLSCSESIPALYACEFTSLCFHI